MLVSWHCFPLKVHFKLGKLLFFYTGTFLQKWQKWLHKPHIELWNPYCLTSFEILQNNDPYNIQGLSPLCYKVPVGSRWLPRPAPCGLFLKDSHCHAPAHAFSEGGQISPHMDSTRKVHMKRKNQKYSTEPKSQHFFQDLNLIPHPSVNMPEKALHGKRDYIAAKDTFCSLNSPSSTTHILICAFLIEA